MTSNKKIIIALLFWITGLVVTSFADGRTWTAKSGQTIEGEFVKMEGEIVHIVVSDGRVAKVSLDKLSEPDQKFAKEQAAIPGAAQKEPPSNRLPVGDGDTIAVVVTGYGKDGDSALMNALRAAVEQAVGTLVDAETLVENDQLVRDKILTFSGGFVKTYKLLGDPKTEDGLVSVRISAEVQRGDLNEKLRSAGIKISVSGKDIAGEALTKIISREDGITMLENLLEPFPGNVLEISLAGKPRYDIDSQKVIIDVVTKVDTGKYAAFTKELTDMALKVDGKKLKGQVMALKRMNVDLDSRSRSLGSDELTATFFEWPFGPSSRLPHQLPLFCIANADSWPKFTRPGQENRASFDFYSVPEDVFGMIRPMFASKNMVVEVLDAKDDIIITSRIEASEPYFRAHVGDYSTLYRYNNNPKNIVFFFPVLSVNSAKPNSYSRLSDEILWPGMPEFQREVSLDIQREDMERIRNIQFRFESK